MNKLFFIIFLLATLSGFKLMENQNGLRVDLRGKHLKAIPDSVLNNRNVVFLDLGSSNVTFYPPLSALEDPNSNHLAELPESIGGLTNLKTLILNTNNLRILPQSISNLSQLEVLDLSINKELDIVKELDKLSQLPKLKTLKIVDVKLQRNDFDKVRNALRPETKIIVSVLDYLESVEKK